MPRSYLVSVLIKLKRLLHRLVIRQFGAIMDVRAAWSGYGPMHRIFFFVVLVALAAWLDSYLNDGFYTRAVMGMLSDISVHFN